MEKDLDELDNLVRFLLGDKIPAIRKIHRAAERYKENKVPFASNEYSYKLDYEKGEILAYLAGYGKEDISIQFLPEDNEIRISDISDEQATKPLFAFRIPEGFQFKNSEAKMENGLLSIKFAKESIPVNKIQTLKIQ